MKHWFKLLKKYLLKAPEQLLRQKFLSITSVLLFGLIIFWLNVIFSLQFFSEYTLESLEQRADFIIPLSDNYDGFDFESLQNELMKANDFNLQAVILPPQQVGAVQIPTRYQVKFSKLEDVRPVFDIIKKNRYSELIRGWDGVAERDFTLLVDKILEVRNFVTKLTFLFVGLFFLGGLILILNTFKLLMYARKEEIFVSRMVGASKPMIVSPFICEGVVLAFFAAILSIVFFTLMLTQIKVLPADAIFIYLWENIYFWQILLSVIVGGLGAYFATTKYLRRNSV